ncbi:MAG: response regulator transcription factor [Candidatus Acidiferrum sp.]
MYDPAPASPARVFLLIYNRLLREALVRLFRKKPDFVVVDQPSGSDETSIDNLENRCDVLLSDSLVASCPPACLPPQGGAPASYKTIVIGMNADEDQFMAAVRCGVSGYLLQDASASDVVNSVRAVVRGEAVCPPQLCSALFRFVAQTSKEKPLQDSSTRPDLTFRQQQLVTLVAKGLTNKEIAYHLNLSEFTVRNHIHRILKQVDAGSRREAVEVVRAHGYAIS